MIVLPMYQVAAFTNECFGGNPAAVVPLDRWLPDELLQNIAAENNLSETAFFVATESGWHIRWFTPAVEVPLCGHATLASAAVIDAKLGHSSWPITLESASGTLRVDMAGDGYELDFPANPPQAAPLPPGLDDALGCELTEFFVAHDMQMVPLPDQRSVAAVSPDFARLAELVDHGVIVTAPGETADFVSRFFAPAIGIDEDPVTGAAHCVLVPYWSDRLRQSKLEARQISSRVGFLSCEHRGDRVGLRGDVTFFLEGSIRIPG